MTGGETSNGWRVRRARPDERDAVVAVLDGGNLETDVEAVETAVERGAVFVAVRVDAAATVLGALVLDGNEITNVAVRRRRRGQGIGTALVRTAAADHGTLVAEFDAGVRPFYEALGFSIEPAAEAGRWIGRGPSDERFDDVAAGRE